MVTIETGYGVFSGETLQAATRAAKKAERAAKRIEEQERKDRAIACRYAMAEAWRLTTYDLHNPWVLLADDAHFPGFVDDGVYRVYLDNARTVFAEFSRGFYRPLAVMLSPSGDVVAVWSVSETGDGERYMFAVGLFNGQWAMERIEPYRCWTSYQDKQQA